MIGETLGPYRVVAKLGEGGMGEVYRAKDTRLGREVALKIPAGGFFDDSESLARFRREAQVLAALNHPNIASIHGIDEANGKQFLVLELVDGESLDSHIARGPLPLEQTIEIARQIIAALDTAHQHGIVHRDLKPSNIVLTNTGVVKVLDFGLAKVEDRSSAHTTDAANSPTIAAPALMTGIGVLLGTAAYMSPEQARGVSADRRSDIWAFGCIVYELLTGARLFAADTVTETLAAVLTRQPDFERVPPQARRLVRQCLQRDAAQRLRDIGDATLLLDEPPPYRSNSPRLPRAVAGAVIVALAIALVLLWPRAVERQLVRLTVDLGGTRRGGALVPAAVSADGTRFVFHSRDESGQFLLATRRLDEPTSTLLTGTAGADQPFFSPDGGWLGFFAASALQKVPVQGGTPIRLTGAAIARGASWGEDGNIVAALSNSSGLSILSADGGEPRPLTTLSPGELTHRWPQVLPGARAVIFTANAATLNSYEDATIDAQSLVTGERTTLWRGGYFGRYLPTRGARGHLVYVRHGVLFAVPFDPDRLMIEGTPTRLLDDVAADAGSAAGHFDFSRTGMFLYQSGVGLRPWTIGWLDSAGMSQPLLSKPALYYSPRFSPDARRLAIGIDGGKGADIYTYDWQRDVMLRLTFSGQTNADPVWSPDGHHVLFRGGLPTDPAIWWVRADGRGEPVRLIEANVEDLAPGSLSPDGRVLIYSTRGQGGNDMWTVSLDLSDIDHPKPGLPAAFFQTPSNESRPAFSPDGRWVAYVSDESGISEIYVRPYPGTATRSGGKWQISAGGGGEPVWSRSGPQLFFAAAGRMMVTDYQTADRTFIAGKPRVWATIAGIDNTGFSRHDLAPDGQRFAILMRSVITGDDQAPRMNLLLNFFDEVRRISPGE